MTHVIGERTDRWKLRRRNVVVEVKHHIQVFLSAHF